MGVAMSYDTQFRNAIDMLQRCNAHCIGKDGSPPEKSEAYATLLQQMIELSATMVAAKEGGLIAESDIAKVAFDAIVLLAISATEREGAEKSVAPEVDRLCEIAGGKPR
jgi:hypothetical protein